LAVSTVRQFIGTSQYFPLASVSFKAMLLTPSSPVIQVTEDVYTGGNSRGDEGGNGVSPMHQAPLLPGNIPGTHFC